MIWNVGAVRDVVAKRAGKLAEFKCPCGCRESLLVPRCCATTLVRVAYDDSEKVLLVVCANCNALVSKVKVAE